MKSGITHNENDQSTSENYKSVQQDMESSSRTASSFGNDNPTLQAEVRCDKESDKTKVS